MKKRILLTFKDVGLVGLALGKSFWWAMTSIISLIVYAVLLIALLNYYEVDYTSIETFVYILRIMMRYWEWFFMIFFISNMYDAWSRRNRYG